MGLCRIGPARTGDHLTPDQVRYQLRYYPINHPSLRIVTVRCFVGWYGTVETPIVARGGLEPPPPPSSTDGLYSGWLDLTAN